jgi:hypothetical protein
MVEIKERKIGRFFKVRLADFYRSNSFILIIKIRRRYVAETFCSGDVVLQETFCYGDVLLRRRFVRRRFVRRRFVRRRFVRRRFVCASILQGGVKEYKEYTVSLRLFHPEIVELLVLGGARVVDNANVNFT